MRFYTALFLLVGILLANGLFAQEMADKKNKGTSNIGIVHSFNSTSFVGDFSDKMYLNKVESSQVSTRTSLSFGIWGEYYLVERLSIEFNALIVSCGSYVTTKTSIYNEVGVFEGSETMKYVLRYVQVPLMVNFYPTEHFYISGGGYASMLAEAHQYKYWYEDVQSIEGVNASDMGFVAGIGFNTPSLRVGVQYTQGVVPVITDNSQSDMYNQMFEIVLRWKIYSETRKK
jgi:hypothetical protein